MKKFYRIAAVMLSVLMVVCLLTACSSDAETPNSDGQSVTDNNVSNDNVGDDAQQNDVSALEAAYEKVVALNLLPTMVALNDNYIDAYYGISADAMSDKLFVIAEDALLADTVIAVKVADGVNAEDIVSSFNSFNEQKKLELESYNPEQYARVSDAVIVAEGGYVFYIVTDDNDTVLNTLKSALGL